MQTIPINRAEAYNFLVTQVIPHIVPVNSEDPYNKPGGLIFYVPYPEYNQVGTLEMFPRIDGNWGVFDNTEEQEIGNNTYRATTAQIVPLILDLVRRRASYIDVEPSRGAPITRIILQ